jgi:hypothetical protein
MIFLYRLVSTQLLTGLYLILFMINTFIELIASYSLGILLGIRKKNDKTMLPLDSFKQNGSTILECIKSNYSQLIIEYFEFYLSTDRSV